MLKLFQNRKEMAETMRDEWNEDGLLYLGPVHIRAVMEIAKANNGRYKVYVGDTRNAYIYAERTIAGEECAVCVIETPLEEILKRDARKGVQGDEK